MADASAGERTSDGTDAEEAIDALAEADAALERSRERIDEFGRDDLEAIRDAYEGFTDLLDRYEEPATGDGDFQTFIEFQGEIETFVERLDDDLLLRETFVECDDYLQQRRLSASDFAHVRDQLAPVADLIGRLEAEREALSDYRKAYSRLQRRRRELAARVDDLERLERLGEADLDAPVERLREPIEAYNDAVAEAFADFRQESPAREVLDVVATTADYPLVEYRAPPEDLLAYLRTHEVGAEPIPRVLSYAGYSRSKLDHYVDDPAALKQQVASQQTYLERLDAAPLTVDWPPPTAESLAYRTREVRAVVARFAPEAVVAKLRAVRRLPHETDFERLRESAVASEELSADERERLRDGTVEADLEASRAGLARVRETLAEYPDR